MDQNCVFEENKSNNHKISERKSVKQTYFGMHMPSRDAGCSGPNLRPPSTCLRNTPLHNRSHCHRMLHTPKDH